MKNVTRLFDFPYFQLENYNLPDALVTKNGSDWIKTSTQEYINKANALSRAILHLGVEKNDKIAIISSNNRTEWHISDIGILPTYYKSESNPIVLIECLQANKPFIASNLGNITNMLYGKNGYAGSIIDLDKNENIVIDTYVEEILKYMLDKDYMTSKIMEIPYAKEKFSMSNVADMYIDFFKI